MQWELRLVMNREPTKPKSASLNSVLYIIEYTINNKR